MGIFIPMFNYTHFLKTKLVTIKQLKKSSLFTQSSYPLRPTNETINPNQLYNKLF
jgi:hypothetical protein